MQKYTLIFDIGKTNKKCLLFDEEFVVQDRVETRLPETVDEDGFPCEDIKQLKTWIIETYTRFHEKYWAKIGFLNFSTYGASLVHLDKKNKIVLPLYNYLKPVQDGYFDAFYKRYGGRDAFAVQTASPAMDFLNSGLQLLWIKRERPTHFRRIKNSLHFPNYCSFLFHGELRSEYTSIGCHTALWDYEKMDYHQWVSDEGILPLLPVKTKGTATFPAALRNDNIQVGVGLHDSSAALLPYLFGVNERFILISTGTWSITLNPFSLAPLTAEELEQDSLLFLRVNGQKVKAARLFLGNEFKVQMEALNKHFSKEKDAFKRIWFREDDMKRYVTPQQRLFGFQSLGETHESQYHQFASFEMAYYQLCYELVLQQVDAFHLAKGDTTGIKTVFIDGGFSNNDVFCNMLARALPEVTLKKTKLAAGSALGAAVVMRPKLFTAERFSKVMGVSKVTG